MQKLSVDSVRVRSAAELPALQTAETEATGAGATTEAAEAARFHLIAVARERAGKFGSVNPCNERRGGNLMLYVVVRVSDTSTVDSTSRVCHRYKRLR